MRPRTRRPHLRLGAPSVGGHLPVKVGRKTWGVPQGARVAHGERRGILYVLWADVVYVLVEDGQVYGLGDGLTRMLREKFFGS